MKKIAVMLSFCFIFVFAFIMPVHAQEAFVIDDANIQMVVHEDGVIDITETLHTNFMSSRHGIYRNIPSQYEMDWVVEGGDVVTKNYYFPIDNITCSTTCDIGMNADGVQIKLGDEDISVNGKQDYTISYSIHTKDLDMNGEQMLYWNLISGFDTQISHLSYQITMPKSFDASNIFTSTGGYMEGGDLLNYNVSGNTIYGETTGVLNNNEAATIKVILSNDYFQFPKPNDYTMPGYVVAALILLISGFLFVKFGKDDEIIVSVEFSAPEGLDSAGVGFVIDNMVDNKDIISLIIYWANKGFVKIHDETTGFKLEKLKEMDTSNSKSYECVFFNAIFEKGDIVDEDQLKNEHIATALASSKKLLHEYFYQDKSRCIYTNSSIVLQIAMLFVIIIPFLIFTFLYGRDYYMLLSFVLPSLIPIGCLLLSCIPWIFLMRKHYVMKRSTVFLSSAFLFVLNGVFVAWTSWTLLMKYKASIMLVGCLAIVTVLCIFMIVFMDKRTKQGNRWLGQILGLKDFILSCEKERLELLVNETPTAFYDILPYAYVLGVSDIWVKKFESIIIMEPDWYQGHGYGNGNIFMTMLWWNHFHYCFNDISNAVSYVPPASASHGGGIFGGGGGFGGGFSGGGFGGGGGGSW